VDRVLTTFFDLLMHLHQSYHNPHGEWFCIHTSSLHSRYELGYHLGLDDEQVYKIGAH